MIVNGVESTTLHELGNTWERFAVEPGTTTFLPVASTWANMFDFEVELRGRISNGFLFHRSQI